MGRKAKRGNDEFRELVKACADIKSFYSEYVINEESSTRLVNDLCSLIEGYEHEIVQKVMDNIVPEK